MYRNIVIDELFEPLFDKFESGLSPETLVISANGNILIGSVYHGCIVVLRSPNRKFTDMSNEEIGAFWDRYVSFCITEPF